MKRILISILSVALLLQSCEETMNVKFSEEGTRKLTVEGSITTDTIPHRVVLSWSSDFFSSDPQEMVSKADLVITDGEKSFKLTETIPGVYFTDPTVYGEKDKTYTLNIKLEDGSVYSANDRVNSLPEVDSVTVSDTSLYMGPDKGDVSGYAILYYGQEKPDPGDFYLWNLYINDTIFNKYYWNSTFTDDKFVNGSYIHDFMVYFIENADLKKDTNTIVLETLSISKNYYNFLLDSNQETVWRGSPWDVPPANINSNVEKGAGFFKASEVKRNKIVLIKKK
jgi:hypothetical protein